METYLRRPYCVAPDCPWTVPVGNIDRAFHTIRIRAEIYNQLNSILQWKSPAYFYTRFAIGNSLCACNSDDLDIQRFTHKDLVCMPMQKNRSGRNGGDTLPTGKRGRIRTGEVLHQVFSAWRIWRATAGWRKWSLNRMTCILWIKPHSGFYYTSHSTDQQVIDVYIEDNFGQVVQKTFSWQNDKGMMEENEDKEIREVELASVRQ